MFETRPTTLKEFLQNMYIDKTDRNLYELLKTWTSDDEARLTQQTPHTIIDSFYTFNPLADISCESGCECGGALEPEPEAEAVCECHHCTVEEEFRSSIAILKGQLRSAIKRIQLLEERDE
jgi:hypothetical protein